MKAKVTELEVVNRMLKKRLEDIESQLEAPVLPADEVPSELQPGFSPPPHPTAPESKMQIAGFLTKEIESDQVSSVHVSGLPNI
jgi:hypothetical protein